MGRREFEFVTRTVRASGHQRRLQIAIGALCAAVVAHGVVVMFHPAGPPAGLPTVAYLVMLASGIVVALCWPLMPWPGYRGAIAFAVWGDVSLAVTAAFLTNPEGRLTTVTYMSLIGLFASLVLGAGPLAAHCIFGAAVVIAFTVWAVLVDGRGLFDLYIYISPVLTTVVLLPLMVQAVIEGGRRAASITVVTAERDPLTGLRNRRGLYRAVRTQLSASADPRLVALAACDIDQFKTLNDDHGHHAGDAVLVALARALDAVVRQIDITARLGGDELVLVAFLDDSRGLDGLVERLRGLTRMDVDGVEVTTSIGLVTARSDDRNFTLDDLIRRADAAMYHAKRVGQGVCVQN